MFRMLYASPIKNLHAYYEASFLSETLKDAHLSPQHVSSILHETGKEREKAKIFMEPFVAGSKFAIIDLTHVFSLSENIISATPGHNSKQEFLPQIHLAFLFSLDRHMPAYFRMIPGSVQDVSSLVLTVKEAGIENAVLIGDKGFYSEDNLKALKKKLSYILPLKRNSSLIDYNIMKKGDRRAFDGCFLFEKRLVWHYSYTAGKDRIAVFMDEKLKAEEEKDWMIRAEKADREQELEALYLHQYWLGTIAVVTDMQIPASEIYSLLKSRVEIETMFDAFKNILHADRTYMREDYQLEGWMFVNFIAIVLYYRLIRMLTEKKLLKNYTPKDVLLHLSRINKLKINNEWTTSEIPKKAKLIIEKIDMPIT